MLEQEIASIMQHILTQGEAPSPYYNEVPKAFIVPAVYFPPPEITAHGDTLSTYALSYTWFVKFFHIDTPRAYTLGLSVLTALQASRNVVPLIDSTGKYTGRGLRLKDSALKRIDGATGTVQLTLSWDSPRAYNSVPAQKARVFDLNMYSRDAYETAVRQIGGI